MSILTNTFSILQRLISKVFKKTYVSPDPEILQDVIYIESHFSEKHFVDFVEKYNSLLLKKSNPLHFSYWGLNFKNGSVHSIKFYAHLNDSLTEQELADFIPHGQDYHKYLAFKSDPSNGISDRNVGTALELKYKLPDKKTVFGFFYMLKNNEAIPFSSRIPVSMSQNCIATGINFEYDADTTLSKRYYYFNDAESIQFFKQKFGSLALEGASLVEYSESDTFSKINVYGNTVGVENIPNFSKREKDIINFFNQKYGLINPVYGIYEEEKIKSVYFFDAMSNIHTSPSVGIKKSFSAKTLNKIIHGNIS